MGPPRAEGPRAGTQRARGAIPRDQTPVRKYPGTARPLAHPANPAATIAPATRDRANAGGDIRESTGFEPGSHPPALAHPAAQAPFAPRQSGQQIADSEAPNR